MRKDIISRLDKLYLNVSCPVPFLSFFLQIFFLFFFRWTKLNLFIFCAEYTLYFHEVLTMQIYSLTSADISFCRLSSGLVLIHCYKLKGSGILRSNFERKNSVKKDVYL